MEISEIPKHLLTDSVSELIQEVCNLEHRLCELNQFESTSPFHAFEFEEVKAELEDARQDLELELTIVRSFQRGFKRKRKAVEAPATPV